MPTYLVLQVLGSNDIRADSEEGAEKLKCCYTLEDIKQQAQSNDDELLQAMERIDFPLIRQLRDSQPLEVNLIFGVILTDQVKWIQEQDIQGEGWNQIIVSDGCWWKTLLTSWCEQQQIRCYPIPLPIGPDIQFGAADWEGMAATISALMGDVVQFERRRIQFQPAESAPIAVDKIIIQHSSGTPALSSALYLWGVEQKLASRNVEFVYISVQNSQIYPHIGQHWQWRLKVPQVRQLLDLQDFSGAWALLSDHPNSLLIQNLQELDKAISLNVLDLNLGLSPKDDVIERISIALWSEQAFRLKEQWMHWYMRVAGALELAIYCLVEQQGGGNYQWQTNNNRIVLSHRSSHTDFRLGIRNTVGDLLDTGRAEIELKKPVAKKVTYTVTKITSTAKWQQFKSFFYDGGWQLDQHQRYSFAHLRNDLYHALLGDRIDHLLDARTTALGSVDHPDHPAKIAVGQLRYIIDLTELKEVVEQRVNHYRNRVNAIKAELA